MIQQIKVLVCIILVGIPLSFLLLGETAGSILLGLLLMALQLTVVAFTPRLRDWASLRSPTLRAETREDGKMDDTQEPLVLDLVEWVAKEPRGYEEAMTAWRTSCPRLTIWEDAQELGYLKRETAEREGALVKVTRAGLRFLEENGRSPGHA